MDEFDALLDELKTLRGDFLLTDPRAAFYREAFAASRFARLRCATAVRLVADDRPDFEMVVDQQVAAYEFTEADTPGRRRGQEIEKDRAISNGLPRVTPFPEEEWLTPAIADQILRAASVKKAGGAYHPSWGLVILLNPTEFDSHRVEIEALMPEATKTAAPKFREVWILWSSRAYNTWLAGQRGSVVLAPAIEPA